jgi:ABC-type antimicrobial peptide transport system permease subunit
MSSAIACAVSALGKNLLRSVLTLTGITIGVAVVIVMVAIAAGARGAIAQQVQAAGANMIFVSAGNYSQGDQDPSSGDVADPGSGSGNLAGGSTSSAEPVAHKARVRDQEGWAGMGISPRVPGRGAATTLVPEDVGAIAVDVDGVEYAAAATTDTAVLTAGGTRLFARLQGTDVTYPDMRALTLSAGRFFSDSQVHERARVLVLSSGAAAQLFGGNEAVGREVQLRRQVFTVAGVAARPGGLAATDERALPEVYLPFTTLQELLGITHLHGVALSVRRAGEPTRVAREVTRLLRSRHGLGPEVPDDFTVRTQARDAVLGKGVNPLLARAVAGSVVNLDDITMAEMALSLERSSRTMTALLASVASVSLLVGGIGIMNIMLVSVTERTREIGLRMALGARGQDVLIQFLAEATTLSLVGGLAGVVIGVALSGGVGRMLKWSTAVSPVSVAVAVGAAAAVGIFFGFYPARQASRLDPIDALRFE